MPPRRVDNNQSSSVPLRGLDRCPASRPAWCSCRVTLCPGCARNNPSEDGKVTSRKRKLTRGRNVYENNEMSVKIYHDYHPNNMLPQVQIPVKIRARTKITFVTIVHSLMEYFTLAALRFLARSRRKTIVVVSGSGPTLRRRSSSSSRTGSIRRRPRPRRPRTATSCTS